MLDMYMTLSSGSHADDRSDAADLEMVKFRSVGVRQLSTRDLMRWCRRIADDFQLHSTSGSNEIFVFREALDCFCGSLSRHSYMVKLAEAIGVKVSMSSRSLGYFLYQYELV